MRVDTWFPTSILVGAIDLDFDPLIKRAYEIKEIAPLDTNWYCNTYNSMAYNLKKDKVFIPVLNKLLKFPLEFTKYFGIGNKKLVCNGAWVNIASPGSYQEYHTHSRSHFSLVLYLKTSENCGNIRFKNLADGEIMFPLPTDNNCYHNLGTCWYPAVQGNVICFRSHLPHMVEVNRSEEDRISLALNFELVDIPNENTN